MTRRVLPCEPVSTSLENALAAAFCRQAQRAASFGVDEGEDFRNGGICGREMPHAQQTLSKHAGAMKQLLMEGSDDREALVGEISAFHADDVKSGEARVLATGKAKRDHVATHAACGSDHRLRPDTDELMGRGEA